MPQKVATFALMEIQAKMDRMLQQHGLDDWNAMQACCNHVATIICQNTPTEDKKENRQKFLETAIDHLTRTVTNAPFLGPDHEIEDWEMIDVRKAAKFKRHAAPELDEETVNKHSGAILAYALKMAKDCAIQNSRAAAVWQPMDQRGNNWFLALVYQKDSPPWDVFVVKDADAAKAICKRLSLDGVHPSKIFEQKKNTRKAS